MRCKGKKLKCMGTVVLVLLMLLCPVFANAQETKLIGTFGEDDYLDPYMDILRHTTFNEEDDTVSVRFEIKTAVTVDFSDLFLRFRYDTKKMTLESYTNGNVSSDITGQELLTNDPFSVLYSFWNYEQLAPGRTICTLKFSVKDRSDSTDVFEENRPYYWVDLGGRYAQSGNPVTVYTDYLYFYKVNLYEGTEVCAHADTSQTNKVAATCTEAGSYDVFCNTCRKTISSGNTIEALTHNYGKWQPKDEKTHLRICANDNSHSETADHQFGDWETVTEATETTEGSRKKSCADCGYVWTEKTDKLEKPDDPDPETPVDPNPENPDDPVPEEPVDPKPENPDDPGSETPVDPKPENPDAPDSDASNSTNPETGDPSLPWLLMWSILWLSSLSGLIVIVFCRYRSRA